MTIPSKFVIVPLSNSLTEKPPLRLFLLDNSGSMCNYEERMQKMIDGLKTDPNVFGIYGFGSGGGHLDDLLMEPYKTPHPTYIAKAIPKFAAIVTNVLLANPEHHVHIVFSSDGGFNDSVDKVFAEFLKLIPATRVTVKCVMIGIGGDARLGENIQAGLSSCPNPDGVFLRSSDWNELEKAMTDFPTTVALGAVNYPVVDGYAIMPEEVANMHRHDTVDSLLLLAKYLRECVYTHATAAILRKHSEQIDKVKQYAQAVLDLLNKTRDESAEESGVDENDESLEGYFRQLEKNEKTDELALASYLKFIEIVVDGTYFTIQNAREREGCVQQTHKRANKLVRSDAEIMTELIKTIDRISVQPKTDDPVVQLEVFAQELVQVKASLMRLNPSYEELMKMMKGIDGFALTVHPDAASFGDAMSGLIVVCVHSGEFKDGQISPKFDQLPAGYIHENALGHLVPNAFVPKMSQGNIEFRRNITGWLNIWLSQYYGHPGSNLPNAYMGMLIGAMMCILKNPLCASPEVREEVVNSCKKHLVDTRMYKVIRKLVEADEFGLAAVRTANDQLPGLLKTVQSKCKLSDYEAKAQSLAPSAMAQAVILWLLVQDGTAHDKLFEFSKKLIIMLLGEMLKFKTYGDVFELHGSEIVQAPNVTDLFRNGPHAECMTKTQAQQLFYARVKNTSDWVHPNPGNEPSVLMSAGFSLHDVFHMVARGDISIEVLINILPTTVLKQQLTEWVKDNLEVLVFVACEPEKQIDLALGRYKTPVQQGTLLRLESRDGNTLPTFHGPEGVHAYLLDLLKRGAAQRMVEKAKIALLRDVLNAYSKEFNEAHANLQFFRQWSTEIACLIEVMSYHRDNGVPIDQMMEWLPKLRTIESENAATGYTPHTGLIRGVCVCKKCQWFGVPSPHFSQHYAEIREDDSKFVTDLHKMMCEYILNDKEFNMQTFKDHCSKHLIQKFFEKGDPKYECENNIQQHSNAALVNVFHELKAKDTHMHDTVRALTKLHEQLDLELVDAEIRESYSDEQLRDAFWVIKTFNL